METVQSISPEVGGLLSTPGFKLLQHEKQLSRQEGIDKGIKQVAISLIKQRGDDEVIKIATGLTQEQINKLKKSLL